MQRAQADPTLPWLQRFTPLFSEDASLKPHSAEKVPRIDPIPTRVAQLHSRSTGISSWHSKWHLWIVSVRSCLRNLLKADLQS